MERHDRESRQEPNRGHVQLGAESRACRQSHQGYSQAKSKEPWRFHADRPGSKSNSWRRCGLSAGRACGLAPDRCTSVRGPTVTAREFDGEKGIWVLQKHKCDATGKPRVIYLTPSIVQMCKRLAEKSPEGPLFRRRSGKPFPPAYYLAKLVRNLRRRLGLRESITPYGLRHGFATDGELPEVFPMRRWRTAGASWDRDAPQALRSPHGEDSRFAGCPSDGTVRRVGRRDGKSKNRCVLPTMVAVIKRPRQPSEQRCPSFPSPAEAYFS